MGVKRKYFEQLNTSNSWKSPVSVIAHIDLDAFFAQCLGLRINADPERPLGCRQWKTLIAVNYPSRKYGIKRGMNIDEAKKLYPDILLPHVATFKKGELEWDFHEEPNAATHKVSLEYFRRESKKIFKILKENFRIVQKAGIDECYVDLGPEIYKKLLTSKPELFQNTTSDELEITYEELIDIGADLVRDVRLQIHETLKYTCSAGISSNKMLAKLGSGFNKPFNQTTIYPDNVPEFLSHFPFTKIGGWRGKAGKHVEDVIKIPVDCRDQCQYIRDKFTLHDLKSAFKGDFALAKDVYDTVRGGSRKEVSSEISVKSMNAVKNFSGNPLRTWEDVDQWLKVYSADISGRLADLDPTDGAVLVPKTITVRKMNQSKQQPFELKGVSIAEIRDQIYQQSFKMCKEFITLPCSYMASEISNFYEIPRERLVFQNMKASLSNNENKDTKNSMNANTPSEKSEDPQPIEKSHDNHGSTNLFLDDDEKCDECGEYITIEKFQEHKDWHFAKKLQNIEKSKGSGAVKRPPSQSVTKRPAKKTPIKSQKNTKSSQGNQMKIMDFFKK